MRVDYDAAQLDWRLTGFIPFQWAFFGLRSFTETQSADIPSLKTSIPGSVQKTLLDAGIIEDWNAGLDARKCEWVENRHWAYEAVVPSDLVKRLVGAGKSVRLVCEGLDYSGWVLINGQEIGVFEGTFKPHVFDLSPYLNLGCEIRLQIVFDTPPRWLGQYGYTSKITAWKPRYNYTWDWTSRLVQVGIWDRMYLVSVDDDSIDELNVSAGWVSSCSPTGGTGTLKAQIRLAKEVENDNRLFRLTLIERRTEADHVIRSEVRSCSRTEYDWAEIPVRAWWPSGLGEQPLYTVRAELLSPERVVLDIAERCVGFRDIRWDNCAGAPPEADPWICVVNGVSVFLQGVNWTPIRPNFADVTTDDVELRLSTYKRLGCNTLRVWGGAFLEREDFYSLCDQLGLMVWQEFPLSSSGMENWPPEEPSVIDELCGIAESYITRRRHHPCLIIWSGGNELQGAPDGAKTGVGRPVDLTHPLMARFRQLIDTKDPGRRFIPTSACGPTFTAREEDFGKHRHWDVHGPWSLWGTMEEWVRYWDNDDALFRSEAGCPGSSSVSVIERYSGDLPVMPCSLENPLWRRTSWWVEWDAFISEAGREPHSLQEYAEWSQLRQADALRIAAERSKRRFPGIGGFIVWMGHDSFPCTSNTSILDFDGNPKPGALALGEVFTSK